MANEITDPLWQQLIPEDVVELIQSVRVIDDGDDVQPWLLYANLTGGERLSIVYDPITKGASVAVSSVAAHVESDFRRRNVGRRAGLDD